MFIKKDARKIPYILEDATKRAKRASCPNPAEDDGNDSGAVEELKFARRAPEFLHSNHTVSMLLQPRFKPALDNLTKLSLYDCGLQSLAGIEEGPDASRPPLFPKLEEIDLGRNPKLTNDSLPESFHTQFPNLLQLWMDDCSIGPSIPETMLRCGRLEVVRLTGNKLEGRLEEGIGLRFWRDIRVLALDGNKLTALGRGLGRLRHLEKIHLRQNNISELPGNFPGTSNLGLKMIGLSSNGLSALHDSFGDVGACLTELYLNGNELTTIPDGLCGKLAGLRTFNLAHNKIGDSEDATPNDDGGGDEVMEDADPVRAALPGDFLERFGGPDPVTGLCAGEEGCTVRLEGNPLTEHLKRRHVEEQKRMAKEAAMEAESTS
mmetsp:Transcript_19039/g.44600  ORF Transcript_19039/g.44600 Transcript_19039/m.44600 type:complete len:377 (-) Transcript_19039:33-1163(-)